MKLKHSWLASHETHLYSWRATRVPIQVIWYLFSKHLNFWSEIGWDRSRRGGDTKFWSNPHCVTDISFQNNFFFKSPGSQRGGVCCTPPPLAARGIKILIRFWAFCTQGQIIKFLKVSRFLIVWDMKGGFDSFNAHRVDLKLFLESNPSRKNINLWHLCYRNAFLL